MLHKWRRLTMGNFVAIIEIVKALGEKHSLKRITHIPAYSHLLHFSPNQICDLAEKIADNDMVWEEERFRNGAECGVFFMPEECCRAGLGDHNQWIPPQQVLKRLRYLLKQSR